MSLSTEDSLRLNVLLAAKPQAIRINESSMRVHALSPVGESQIQLKPNCRDEQYLRHVRELLSGHILGSPGGYPVFIQRWTRMGQARSESLEQLLLLGEPEAVVAVVHAAGLTPELARRAWWAMPDADNARRMLTHPDVAGSSLGRELAVFLLEFLPFEENPMMIAESVRLVLQSGQLEESERLALWKKGRQKNVYYLGFLQAEQGALPERHDARADSIAVQQCLEGIEGGTATLLLKILSAEGQSFLHVSAQILRKPINQDVVNHLLDTVAGYFNAELCLPALDADLDGLFKNAEIFCDPRRTPLPDWRRLLEKKLELRDNLKAVAVLARLSYAVVRPVFSRTDAGGSLMRKKLAPITTPLLEQLDLLRRSVL